MSSTSSEAPIRPSPAGAPLKLLIKMSKARSRARLKEGPVAVHAPGVTGTPEIITLTSVLAEGGEQLAAVTALCRRCGCCSTPRWRSLTCVREFEFRVFLRGLLAMPVC